ncbi:unnamed protein product [Miscanthus lutarioriparius]|uniref:Uncharacterized protein n=1 Tax=Miscanthus lutarioriparius TaxID=422564 RepID=A0A811QID9_9POAL|nr:unnamed protein product [Miscanthus lutarioriparius]
MACNLEVYKKESQHSFKATMPSMLPVLAPGVPLLSATVKGLPSSSLVVTAFPGASLRVKPLGVRVISMKVPHNLSADCYYAAIMRPYVIAAAVLPSSSLPPVGGAALPYSSGVALPIQAEAYTQVAKRSLMFGSTFNNRCFWSSDLTSANVEPFSKSGEAHSISTTHETKFSKTHADQTVERSVDQAE